MLLKTKILSVLFLSIFTVPMICTVAYLAAVKINAHQMQEKLEKSSLQKVLVYTNELVWVKKGKEVLINGKLFDVKSSEIINGKIQLTGLFDTAEDEIIKKISALESNKNDSSSPVYSMLVKLLCPAVLQQNITNTIVDIPAADDKFPDIVCAKSVNPFIDVNTPPPNVQSLYHLI
jgi:hypothetical protein